MSEKKIRITKSQRFEDIIAMLNGGTVKYGTDVTTATEVLNHEIGLLARKNSSDSKKQTAAQKENEGFKTLILEYLVTLPEDSKGVTCTEIMKSIPDFSNFNNQKISALMRQLKIADKVICEEVKGKSLFRLA